MSGGPNDFLNSPHNLISIFKFYFVIFILLATINKILKFSNTTVKNLHQYFCSFSVYIIMPQIETKL